MSDPRQRLSSREVADAGLDDWRQVLDRLKARFRTGDFATGLSLVERIGAAAEEADHHPDVTLTYPEVLVTLSSHDVRGITARDLDLARRISGFAADLGVAADVSGLTQLELGLDTDAGDRLAPFYAALLGGEVRNGESVDPSGQVPTVWWQESGTGDPEQDGPPLPETAVEQRWHLDVWVPVEEGERRLQAVLDAGGSLVSDAAAPCYWVVADAEDNRSCICTVADRD